MNVAIDARIISTGTGRYIRELLRELETLDQTNTYLVLVRKKDLTYYKPTNANFTVVEADFADYSFAEQLGFNRFLRGLNVDLVHFCMPQQPLLYTRPAVTTIHDLNLLRITANDDMGWFELRIKKAIFAGFLWAIAHRTRQIITPSNYTKQDLLKFSHINPDKVSVIYEGAATAGEEATAVTAYKDVPFIMYLGRAEPYKNTRRLIEAHQQLLRQYRNLRLVMVGAIDTLRQADIDWVKKNNYQNVDFTGFLSDAEVAWMYRNCRAYVVPSLMEGFGLPALEAMANGAPVLSSNTTSSPEILGDAAHYFNPHDVGDIARAINDVLGNDDLRNELIARGPTQTAKYSWRRMAEQTLQIYNDSHKTD